MEIKNRLSGPAGQFEVIENEKITNCNINERIVAGALLSFNVFDNITFKSCTFFASKLENCQFFNCNFINCSFQFSNIIYCDYHFSKFENCTWDTSFAKKSLFSRCEIDFKSLNYLNYEGSGNKFLSCNKQNNGEQLTASKIVGKEKEDNEKKSDKKESDKDQTEIYIMEDWAA